ncbi:MAG: hypothetical protein LBK71_11845 [Verrucomicrobiales bacterium]|nr:hypothetical protein [Verrucomicrobiales bacterium]
MAAVIWWLVTVSGGAKEITNFNDLMKLSGDEFYQAARESQFGELGQQMTLANYWQILDRMIDEKMYADKEHWTSFISLVDHTCALIDNAEDLSSLTAKAAALPVSGYVKSLLVSPLMDAKLRLLLRDLEKNPPLKISLPPVKMHHALRRQYSPELQTALTNFTLLAAPYQKLAQAAKSNGRDNGPAVSFLINEKVFWSRIFDLVLDRDDVRAEEFLHYTWGSRCGTGSEPFMAAQAKAIWLALIKERRLAEAAGAAIMGGLRRDDQGQDNLNRRIQFLKIVADDWPVGPVFAGGLLTVETRKETVGDDDFDHDGLRENCLALIVTAGGDDAARLLLELARSAADEKTLPQYLGALARLVAAGPIYHADGQRLYRGYDSATITVSGEVQALIIRFICAKAGADAAVSLNTAVADALARMTRPETKDTLRRLVNDQPSQGVAEQAARTLREMGEALTVPKKPGPARYRVLVNGRALADIELYCSVYYRAKHSEQILWPTTDADGVLEIPRDLFLDQQNPALTVYARTHDAKDVDAPLLSVELPLPDESDETREVRLETRPFELALTLPRPLAEYAGREMRVNVSRQWGTAEKDYALNARASLTLPVAERVRFAALMAGKYSLIVSLPGAAVWRGEFDPAAGDPKTVTLTKATDARCQPVKPASWPDDGSAFYPTAFLLRNGKHFDHDSGDGSYEYRGLPPGQYALQFLSCEEAEKRRGFKKLNAPAYRGKTVEFEIPADSPLTLDLGEIMFEVP